MTGVKHESLAEALAAFQAEVPVFAKDKTATVRMKSGGTYSYKYADLGDILPIVNPLLAKHGLSWSSKPGCVDGNMMLYFVLRHVSSEQDEGVVPLGLGQSYSPQDLGSAISYLRRYSMTAHLNITTDEDVDGRVTVQEPVSARASNPGNRLQVPQPSPSRVALVGQIRTRFDEARLPSTARANIILEVTGHGAHAWENDAEASAMVARALETKLSDAELQKLLAAIEAPE